VKRPAHLLPAALWYLLFFLGMALLAWSLFTLLLGTVDLRTLPIVSAAFLISWLLGFVIPGAPGGIGVREGAFAALGSVFLAPDPLVIVAVLMRIVTLMGEALLFLLAVWAARPAQPRDAGTAAGRLQPARERRRPGP
jgi:glycosyltransferase 2 family protein